MDVAPPAMELHAISRISAGFGYRFHLELSGRLKHPSTIELGSGSAAIRETLAVG